MNINRSARTLCRRAWSYQANFLNKSSLRNLCCRFGGCSDGSDSRRFFASPSFQQALAESSSSFQQGNSVNKKGQEEVCALLRQELQGRDIELTTNRYEIERHGKGESHHRTSRQPDVVVYPRNTEDVVAVVKCCMRHKIPIIPFGAGTSVEGHVNALYGGVSLDLSLLQDLQIPEISMNETGSEESSWPNPVAVVGAGVRRLQLNQALRHTGLQCTVDPGADATLGGMVSTGASGTTTIRYGTMRDNILGLTAVMALPKNGNDNSDDCEPSVVHVGTSGGALKNSAGYDLLSLLCGSEGTLGIITEITVKLHPIPTHVVAATCTFGSLHAAAQAVAALRMILTEGSLVRCELLDAPSVHAFNTYQRNDDSPAPSSSLPVQPTLFLEFQGSSERSLSEQAALAENICEDYQDEANDGDENSFSLAWDADERQQLWKARHSLYYAAIASRRGAERAIVTDVCVPLSRLAEVIDATARDVQTLGLESGPCFGHAGDGNFHCILPVLDDDDEAYWDKLRTVQENLIQRTLEAGGTCTGEHGVGYGKKNYLERQYGPGAVEVMRSIKRALDPFNILNPGKVVDL